MFYLAEGAYGPAPKADGIEILDQSIERTKKNLEEQKKIKELLVDFKKLKKRFMRKESSAAEAWQMVKLSEEILHRISDARLEQLFALEFLEEMKMVSSYAKKSSVGLK